MNPQINGEWANIWFFIEWNITRSRNSTPMSYLYLLAFQLIRMFLRVICVIPFYGQIIFHCKNMQLLIYSFIRWPFFHYVFVIFLVVSLGTSDHTELIPVMYRIVIYLIYLIYSYSYFLFFVLPLLLYILNLGMFFPILFQLKSVLWVELGDLCSYCLFSCYTIFLYHYYKMRCWDSCLVFLWYAWHEAGQQQPLVCSAYLSQCLTSTLQGKLAKDNQGASVLRWPCLKALWPYA